MIDKAHMLKKSRVAKLFLDLVKIDSPAGEEVKIAAAIIAFLRRLKIQAVRDHTGNVIARINGQGEWLLLNAHMDTIASNRGLKPVVAKGVIRSDGNSILGADAKAGIAAILSAVEFLTERRRRHRPLELVFTVDEERSCRGAYNLSYRSLKAKTGAVFDLHGALGRIVVAAPYIYDLNITIIGQAAHAGIEPEKGVNALTLAAKAISDINLGRINLRTTANFGVLNAGTATNTVPARAEIKGEVRSLSLAAAQRQVDVISRVFKKYVRRYGAKLNFRSHLVGHGYRYAPHEPIIKDMAAAWRQVGIKPTLIATNAFSDANIFKKNRLTTAVTAYGGGGSHTPQEAIKVNDLLVLTKFIIELVKVK